MRSYPRAKEQIYATQADNQSVGRSSRRSFRNGSLGADSFNRSTSSAARSQRSSQQRRGGESQRGPVLDGLTYIEQVKVLKDELQRQRRKNIDLERQISTYKKAASVTGSKENQKIQREHENLKKDYNQLLDAFQRSESIRTQQNELIKNFKVEISQYKETIRKGGLSHPAVNDVDKRSNSPS